MFLLVVAIVVSLFLNNKVLECAYLEEYIITCFANEDSVQIVNWFIQQPTDHNYN
jgi:hypothetical protein